LESLARAGRLSDAQTCLERISSYSDHLGLFAEEFDVKGH
jgi:GH15 family glucan-1,4-alpha-glucosidase